MNESLLELIDESIKQKGYPFKKIWISKSYFPEEFNKLVSKEFKKINSRDKINDDYCLMYDENGNLVFCAFSTTTNLVLCDNPRETKLNFPCTVTYFGRIFFQSCINKYTKDDREQTRQIIIESNPMKDDEGVEEELDKIMNVQNKRIETELMKSNDDIFKRDSSLLMDFIKTYNMVKDYIDYMNTAYKKDIASQVIVYEQDKSDYEQRHENGKYVPQKEDKRKYGQIPVSERLSTLESHDYIYKCQGREKSCNDISDLCYLYRNSDSEYRLVIEPYSGEKITKIVSLDTNSEINREEFLNYVRKYLSISTKDILSSKNVVQLYHTTYETFKNAIDYAITKDEGIELNLYTKNNIKSLSNSPDGPKLR